MPTAYSTAQSILVNLDLDKVALCEQGANSRADILLFKRKENTDMPKTFEELMKALEPENAEVISKHLKEVEKVKEEDIAKLNSTIMNLKAEAVKTKDAIGKKEEGLKGKPEGGAVSAEDIIKAAGPEVANYITGLQKSVKELVAAREESLAKARFEEVKALPVEEETLKSILKSASPAVFEVLKKAAAAVEESVLVQKGKELPGNSFENANAAAYDKLSKSAKAFMDEAAGVSFEQAFTKACEANPEEYAKYVKGGC